MSLPITQQILFIYVTNIRESAKFYEDVMGFELWLDQGKCRIYQITSGGYLGICYRENSPTTDSSKTDIILTIVTPAVDEWYSHLTRNGVKFQKQPEINQDFNIYHCFLKDPDGYIIEIQTFLEDY